MKKFRKNGTKVYTKQQVSVLISNAGLLNKNLIPYQGEGICATCGNNGLTHPKTSYCFLCNTDNWKETNNN